MPQLEQVQQTPAAVGSSLNRTHSLLTTGVPFSHCSFSRQLARWSVPRCGQEPRPPCHQLLQPHYRAFTPLAYNVFLLSHGEPSADDMEGLLLKVDLLPGGSRCFANPQEALQEASLQHLACLAQ